MKKFAAIAAAFGLSALALSGCASSGAATSAQATAENPMVISIPFASLRHKTL